MRFCAYIERARYTGKKKRKILSMQNLRNVGGLGAKRPGVFTNITNIICKTLCHLETTLTNYKTIFFKRIQSSAEVAEQSLATYSTVFYQQFALYPSFNFNYPSFSFNYTSSISVVQV